MCGLSSDSMAYASGVSVPGRGVDGPGPGPLKGPRP